MVDISYISFFTSITYLFFLSRLRYVTYGFVFLSSCIDFKLDKLNVFMVPNDENVRKSTFQTLFTAWTSLTCRMFRMS